jgi:hypothetical protein
VKGNKEWRCKEVSAGGVSLFVNSLSRENSVCSKRSGLFALIEIDSTMDACTYAWSWQITITTSRSNHYSGCDIDYLITLSHSAEVLATRSTGVILGYISSR